IGANCGRSLDDMEKVVDELASVKAGIPLWIKPNAGLPRMDGDVARYDTTPETMAAFAERFLTAGARIVGGCCGSSPAHVAAAAAGDRSAARRLRRVSTSTALAAAQLALAREYGFPSWARLKAEVDRRRAASSPLRSPARPELQTWKGMRDWMASLLQRRTGRD